MKTEEKIDGYRVIIEKAKGNFSAYAPALLGCVATGATKEKARQNMQSAIRLHLRNNGGKK